MHKKIGNDKRKERDYTIWSKQRNSTILYKPQHCQQYQTGLKQKPYDKKLNSFHKIKTFMHL